MRSYDAHSYHWGGCFFRTSSAGCLPHTPKRARGGSRRRPWRRRQALRRLAQGTGLRDGPLPFRVAVSSAGTAGTWTDR